MKLLFVLILTTLYQAIALSQIDDFQCKLDIELKLGTRVPIVGVSLSDTGLFAALLQTKQTQNKLSQYWEFIGNESVA